MSFHSTKKEILRRSRKITGGRKHHAIRSHTVEHSIEHEQQLNRMFECSLN